MIKCLLCNKNFICITGMHLKKEHNINLTIYKEMFSDAMTINPITSNKLRDSIKETYRKNKNIGFKKGVSHNKGKIPWNKGLTKETDKRVLGYSKSLSGRNLTEKHKQKLSKVRTKHKHYNICQICGVKKSNTTRELCMKCAGKKRRENPNYRNGMLGKKLSLKHKEILLTSQRYSFTKPEIRVMMACNEIDYTGNRRFWLRFKDKSWKNPDFIYDTSKIAIEVFGDYWHKEEEKDILIQKYNEIGWDCLILWESFINNMSLNTIKEEIMFFIENHKLRRISYDS